MPKICPTQEIYELIAPAPDSPARWRHPVLEKQITASFSTGPGEVPVGVLAEAAARRPSDLEKFLTQVAYAYREFDNCLAVSSSYLDIAIQEAEQLNQELRDRARTLESALKEKNGALEALTKARDMVWQHEKLASIGTLAAGIAHEINTPTQFVGDNISFLQGAFTDLLALVNAVEGWSALPGPERGSEGALKPLLLALESMDLQFIKAEVPAALSQSAEGIERVSNIVRSIKEFSHPGSREKVLTDLNHCVRNTLAVSRNEWKYVSEVEASLEEGLPMISCVPGEINQVLLNLVVNAAQAIQDSRLGDQGKGLINIRTRLEGGSVCVSISDNGCGIPPEVQGRIFDPFFTTKEVGRGTGQGLAIAHSVVTQRHKGQLRFETEPGKGTTFHLCLPVCQEAA